MGKHIQALQRFGYSIIFVLLGFYILNTNDTFLGKTLGVSCVIFFGGLLLWGIFNKPKGSKTE